VGCSAGSEIVTVANAGGYTSIAAAQIGASVVYADVDPATQLMTAETLGQVVGDTTRAVVVTHLYGNIAEMGPIVAMCRDRRIRVVEDCAQAIGGVLDGRRAGTFGDAAAISFYPTKNLGAAGDGGAVISNDDAIAERARRLRQYGWSHRYHVESGGGRNSRLDELQAAILRIGLRRLDDITARRQAIVDRYRAVVAATETRFVTGASRVTVAHLAVLRTPDRDRVRARMQDSGIATDIHYPTPDHRQPGLARPARATGLPCSELAAAEVVTVPCFPEMTGSEVDRVCEALRAVSGA
jgi:aminotransferase EvaB